MDNSSEKQLIAALLTAGRNEQDKFYARHFPKGLFVFSETEIDWVYKYRERYGRYPSRSAYESRFEEELPKVREPLPALLQKIMDASMLSQMRALIEDIKKKQTQGVDASSLLEQFKAKASRLQSFDAHSSDLDLSSSDVAYEEYHTTAKLMSSNPEMLLRSPWPTLNKLIGHFRSGEVVTIAARTSLGKSWMLLYWMNYYASKGHSVIIDSREMSQRSVASRVEAIRYGLPWEHYRQGCLPPRLLGSWRRARLANLRNTVAYPLTILGGDSASENSLGLARFTQKVMSIGPRVAAMDSAYLARPESVSRGAKPNEYMAAVSSYAKTLAKSTGTVIFLVVQMGRGEESKDGTSKGSLVSVFGSDSWAQDCDWLLDLSGRRGSAFRTVSLLKGRESNVGSFNLSFKLDPPNFPETAVAAPSSGAVSGGSVSFKGIQ